jgi:hypothetical protein
MISPVTEPAKAISQCEATVADRVRELGSDHPDTLSARDDLARQSAVDLDTAIALFEAALTDMERLFDSDHPGILHARNNLASAYQQVASYLGR